MPNSKSYPNTNTHKITDYVNQHPTLWKFKLVQNSKFPVNPWYQESRTKEEAKALQAEKGGWKNKTFWKKDLIPNYHEHNVGIPTGIDNNITVVDLDMQKWDEDHIFPKEFKEECGVYFNTLTQKTRSGGFHLIFKYDPKVRATQNKLLHIDIKMMAGTS